MHGRGGADMWRVIGRNFGEKEDNLGPREAENRARGVRISLPGAEVAAKMQNDSRGSP